ncbi:MAG TPA: bifunctional DNA primase/polymerase [Micromonospora sp.]|nr:bifunctional DNA primase/polymerase [Micromonospora sp.]
MSDLLDAALRYAATGWPVVPCWPGAKVPLTRHGVKDATTDPTTITAWWSRCPAANVAIATGAPGPDVVDIDTKNGASGRASYDRLRDAGLLVGAFALVITPSGGWHLYYSGTDQGNGALGRHGVDFRGRGGYVLAPPSIIGGKPYELADRREPTGVAVDWQAIRRHLDPPRLVGPPRVRPGQRSDHRRLVEWVAAQAEGNRNSGLFWAACRALQTGGDGQVLAELVRAAVAAGLPEPEATRTVWSAHLRTGVGQ